MHFVLLKSDPQLWNILWNIHLNGPFEKSDKPQKQIPPATSKNLTVQNVASNYGCLRKSRYLITDVQLLFETGNLLFKGYFFPISFFGAKVCWFKFLIVAKVIVFFV